VQDKNIITGDTTNILHHVGLINSNLAALSDQSEGLLQIARHVSRLQHF